MGSDVGVAPEPAASPAERYRDRARSATTLVVTAAGALVAGLVFSPIRDALSPAAQVAGYISLIFFIISGCFYLQASLYSKPEGTGSKESFTNSIIDKIRSSTRYGSMAGVVAAGAALMVIPFDTYFPEPDVPVTVLLAESLQTMPGCPELKRPFSGWMSLEDLRGNSVLIPMKVESHECGNTSGKGRIDIFVERKSVTVTVQPEPTKND